jgi:hypothetical protein
LQNAGTLAIIESAIIFDLGDKVFFTGYHGTSQESGFNILESKRFIPSTGKKNWLGSGIYFYEKYSDALNWANERYCQNSSILHVVVSVGENEYIDLDSEYGKQIYQKVVHVIAKRFDYLVKGKAQENQCAVANFLWSKYLHINVLYASFPTEPSKFPLLKDARAKRREFCVRGNENIKGIQLIELKE